MNAPATNSRKIRIGLLWHASGAGNLGMGALSVGNIIAARAAASSLGLTPSFTIMEFPTDLPAYISGPDIERFEITTPSMISPAGYLAKLGDLDCVLDIGAGDSFADIYGGKRFAFLLATKELAMLRGIPLMLSPQTIGPFTKQPYRVLAAHAMRKAAAVVARDPQSFEAIRTIAPGARAVQSVDVAFRLPFERPVRAPGGPVEVGVNVSGLLFNGGYKGGDGFGLQVDYPTLMRRFIGEMAGRSGVRVHLVCHVFSERLPLDDDARVADLLAAEFPSVVRAPNFDSPTAAKSYIAGLDFLTAARMHACIAAHSAGVAVVPIAYSRKFSGLFEGVLDYPYGVPVSGLSTDEALDYLLKCFDDRAELAAAIALSGPVIQQAFAEYDDELRRLFATISVRKYKAR